jgi:hypothetical protein
VADVEVVAWVGAIAGSIGAVTGVLGLVLQLMRDRPRCSATYEHPIASMRIANGSRLTTLASIGIALDRRRRWAVRGDRWDLSGGTMLPGPYVLQPDEVRFFPLLDAVRIATDDARNVPWSRLRPYVRDARTNRIVWAKQRPLRGGAGPLMKPPTPDI